MDKHNNEEVKEDVVFTYGGSFVLLGLFMGIVDSIPGFSGSTVAAIAKQYEFIIQSISKIFTKEFFKELFQSLHLIKFSDFMKKYNLDKLFFLFSGIGVGFLLSFVTVATLVEFYREIMMKLFSFFMTLVVCYYIYTYRDILLNNFNFIYGLIFVKTIIILLLLFLAVLPAINPNSLYMVFVGAFLAINAMLLPGISGSLVLIIIGLYTKLKDALILLDYTFLGVFLLGILTGAFVGIKVLSHVTKKYEVGIKFSIMGILVFASVYLFFI